MGGDTCTLMVSGVVFDTDEELFPRLGFEVWIDSEDDFSEAAGFSSRFDSLKKE